ncbi:AAA family ATPase [Candidatus Daviesbacteria bacterium]|nr:AAA family ATPase [Candidatus Daviesbacteria bacterium]
MTASNHLFSEITQLEKTIQNSELPQNLRAKISNSLSRLEGAARFGGYLNEHESLLRYADWVLNLPWEKTSDDILNLAQARKIFDKNHYGLTNIKERILEYLSVLSLKKGQNAAVRAPILCLVGLVGTGKTTLAASIAEAMGRKIARIPFGGMGDARELRGQSRTLPDAEPGQIIKALRRIQVKNPVILLDEIDRVAESTRSDLMGVLVELLDPEQNMAFVDHYIDYPFDLSQVLFIATANNTTNISTAVLDRLEPIQMPSYTDEEKIMIAGAYILPKAIAESGLAPNVVIVDGDVWPKIVRPLGFDAGIRTLERTVSGICRKVAKQIVEGKGKQFHITLANVNEFLPVW